MRRSAWRPIFKARRPTETLSKMPKLKTKSGAKKRFKITAQAKWSMRNGANATE